MSETELIVRHVLSLVQLILLGVGGWMWSESRWWFWPACASTGLLIGTMRCVGWFDAPGWAAVYAFAAGALAFAAADRFTKSSDGRPSSGLSDSAVAHLPCRVDGASPPGAPSKNERGT